MEIPLPCIPRSKLCPTAAVINAFRFTATVSTTDSQAFNWLDERQAAKVFTYKSFVLVLRRHLASLGFDPSFTRGILFAEEVILSPITQGYPLN